MKKTQLCSFGKKINHRLVTLGQTKTWLIQSVKERTGLYFDHSYLRKIEVGTLSTPTIVQAICEVLSISSNSTTKRDR